MILGHQGFLTSGDQDAKTPRLQSVLISRHHYLMMELVQDLFILFWCSFVPDVSFGNGWFASSDWPANKRERDVIFDPFLGVRNIICFAPGKLCFQLREIDFVTENSLPARGWNSSGVVVFYRAPHVPTPNFRQSVDFRRFHSKLALRRPVFEICCHTKPGQFI